MHSSRCPACRRVIPKLLANEDFIASSRDFVLINALDNQVPEAIKYGPDGFYVPRFEFFFFFFKYFILL